MSLANNEVKHLIVNLKMQGYSHREIEEQTGVPRSTVQEFLARKTYRDWWGEFEGVSTDHEDGYKMVFLDIEVAPSIVLAFSMFKHFSTPDHIMQFPYVLTAAWNWLHESEDVVHHRALPDYDTFDEDVTNDYELICDLWKVLDECDVVVIQNSKFDLGWVQQQFVIHGLPQPSPFRVICTLKNDKQNFSLPSNSLGYVVKYFRLEQEKLKHDGIDLWKRCMAGDLDAFADMIEYNCGDIPTLRNLYLATRAHIEKHPNLSIYYKDGKTRCPVCGGDNLEELDGKLAFTNLSKFASYRCGDCGTVKRSSQALNTSENRKSLLRNVIR